MRLPTMNRRQSITAGVIVAVVAGFALVLVAIGRKARYERAAPAWLDPEQPPDGVAASLPCVTPDQSWAANRARHMSGACTGQTAGNRVRRTYPETLASSSASFVAQIGGA